MNKDYKAILQRLRPYATDIKVIIGLLMVLFSLYTATTDLPGKWSTYQSATQKYQSALTMKDSVAEEVNKLNAYSRELDKLTTKIVTVGPDNTPELVGINVAQKVQALSKINGTLLENLPPRVINIATSVTLPISAPAASGGGGMASNPAGSPPAAGGGNGSTSSAPAPPPSGGNNATDTQKAADSINTFNCFEYRITVKGTYVQIAQFLHDVAQMTDLVIVNGLQISQNGESSAPDSTSPSPSSLSMPTPSTMPGGSGSNGKPSSVNTNQIVLKMEFGIPWRQGRATDISKSTPAAPAIGEPPNTSPSAHPQSSSGSATSPNTPQAGKQPISTTASPKVQNPSKPVIITPSQTTLPKKAP